MCLAPRLEMGCHECGICGLLLGLIRRGYMGELIGQNFVDTEKIYTPFFGRDDLALADFSVNTSI